MDSLELKNKSEQFFKKKGLDKALVEFYDFAQHFSSWKKEKNFEEYYNVGLKNINRQSDESGYTEDFTHAEFQGTAFKYGGKTKCDCYDGSVCWWMDLIFYLEDNLVIAARYYKSGASDYVRPVDFSFSSLEEFHYSENLETLLLNLQDAIQKQKIRQEVIDGQQKNDQYKGKFTLPNLG